MAKSTLVQKILLYILIALVASIILLSVILAASGAVGAKKNGNMPVSTGEPHLDIDGFEIFDGIGKLRLSTCDAEPVPFVLSVYFYYPTEDLYVILPPYSERHGMQYVRSAENA